MLRSCRVHGFEVCYRSREEVDELREEIFDEEIYAFETSREDPTILDCGGHIGLATLWFKMKFPRARVLVFEPDPDNVEILRRNVSTNGLDRVRIVPAAVWSGTGRATLYRERSSIQAFTLGNTLIENLWGDGEDVPAGGVLTVALSHFVEGPVDFLKLDVEGAEEIVLRELGNTLSRIRRLCIEYHGTDTGRPLNRLDRILALLDRRGFRSHVTHKDVWRYARKQVERGLHPEMAIIRANNLPYDSL